MINILLKNTFILSYPNTNFMQEAYGLNQPPFWGWGGAYRWSDQGFPPSILVSFVVFLTLDMISRSGENFMPEAHVVNQPPFGGICGGPPKRTPRIQDS